MPRLTIPPGDRDKLARLVSLETDELSALEQAIKDADPHLTQGSLTTEIARRIGSGRPDIAELIQLLLTLYAVRDSQGFSAAEMAERLEEAAQEIDDERLTTPVRGWEAVRGDLTRLLSYDRSIGVTSKASFVAYDFPQHFHGARILTDARPIFSSNPSEPPTSFILTHTLKVDVHSNGENRAIYVTLTADDLRTIRNVVDRAVAKEETLRAVLSATGVPILRPDEQ